MNMRVKGKGESYCNKIFFEGDGERKGDKKGF